MGGALPDERRSGATNTGDQAGDQAPPTGDQPPPTGDQAEISRHLPERVAGCHTPAGLMWRAERRPARSAPRRTATATPARPPARSTPSMPGLGDPPMVRKQRVVLGEGSPAVPHTGGLLVAHR